MLTDINSADLAALQRDLRATERDFANGMQKSLRDAVAPFTAVLKASARTNLPSYIAADAAATVKQSVGFKGVSVKSDPTSRFTQGAYVDQQGAVRHPLFGNRDYWYDTPLSGAEGWWSKVGDDNVDETSERLVDAVNLIMNRVSAGNFATSKVGRSTVIA